MNLHFSVHLLDCVGFCVCSMSFCAIVVRDAPILQFWLIFIKLMIEKYKLFSNQSIFILDAILSKKNINKYIKHFED